MAAILAWLLHRPEALAVYKHASRALLSQCCKAIYCLIVFIAMFRLLKIFWALSIYEMAVGSEAQPYYKKE